MEDDILVDVENEPGPSNSRASTSNIDPALLPGPSTSGAGAGSAADGARHSSRLRSSTLAAKASADAAVVSDRSTRVVGSGGGVRQRGAPKLKLKLSEKGNAQSVGMSFLGPYDRELDSDDEELAFEEQFILRMPPGEDCEKLRKMVQSREVTNDVWFKFKGQCISRTVWRVFNMLQIRAALSSTLVTTRTTQNLLIFPV